MLPTGLSMLWERTDPHLALRDRFGFDGFDEAVRWLTGVLTEVWSVDAGACDRIVISDNNAIAWIRTDQEALVVKWSRAQEQFGRYDAAADLLKALHHEGVPVAPPLTSVDGRNRVVVSTGAWPLSMTVQPRIDGVFLDPTDGSSVRSAGVCLARLHAALAGHEDPRLAASAAQPPLDLRQRIERWLDAEGPGRVPEAAQRLREQVARLPRLDTEPQWIHNDYRAANILTADSEIVAVLDFDEITWDHPVCDVAKAGVYLSTLFTDWQPTPAAVRRTFLDGYRSVRPLTRAEEQWLEALVLWGGINAVPPGDDPAGWAKALSDSPAGGGGPQGPADRVRAC